MQACDIQLNLQGRLFCHLQDAVQQTIGCGDDPELRLLKLLFYLVPEDFAKQGSLGVQRGKVLNCCQDGCQPLCNELPDAVLGGKVG